MKINKRKKHKRILNTAKFEKKKKKKRKKAKFKKKKKN